jgi:hypothetical protein
MKKNLLILLVIGLFSSYTNAQFVRPVALIKVATVVPVLDGNIDEVWTTADAHNIENPKAGENPSLGASGTTYWKALWSPDGFYILIVVNDNVFFPAFDGLNPTQTWDYDKAEMYFDVNEALQDGGKWGSGHYQIAPGFTKGSINGEVINGKDDSGLIDFLSAFKVTAPSWVGEYFIPFVGLNDATGTPMDKTREIGFDIYLIDVDVEGVINQATWGEYGDNLDNAGIITLDGAGSEVFASAITVSSTGNATTINSDNGTLQMISTVAPANTWNKNVKWSVVFETGKASISSTGLVTGIKNGTVTVYATSANGNVSGYFDLDISGQTTTLNEVNIIKNGNFDAGITGWDSWAEVGAGDAAFVSDGVVMCNALTAADIWLYSLSQNNLQALPDVPYILRFVAWSDVERLINVNFQDNPNNYNNFGISTDALSNGRSSWTLPITTTPATYTFTVTFDQILPNTIQTFEFFLAQADGMVSIDSIYLIEEAELVLSVPMAASGSNITVYPNPVVSEMYFSEDVSDLTIYNQLGKEVANYSKVTSRKINAATLNSGFYFLSFTNSKGNKSFSRIIKQ